MEKIWQDKINDATINLEIAEKELKLINLQANEKKDIKGIEKWLNYTFESSSALTPEFAQFRREIKTYIKKQLDANLELIMPFGTLHFSFSGFIKNKLTGKLVYFSCDDVRGNNDAWYNNLLIRTALNEKDFTGGSNNWCELPNLSQKALLLTL